MTPVLELSIHCYRHHFFFLFPQLALGLGTAAGVRVGNELGAGRPLKAKRVTYTAIGIMCMRDIVYSVATKMATFSAHSVLSCSLHCHYNDCCANSFPEGDWKALHER